MFWKNSGTKTFTPYRLIVIVVVVVIGKIMKFGHEQLDVYVKEEAEVKYMAITTTNTFKNELLSESQARLSRNRVIHSK